MKLRTHGRLLLAALVLGLVLQPLAAFAAPAFGTAPSGRPDADMRRLLTATGVSAMAADDDYPTAPLAPASPFTTTADAESDWTDIYRIPLSAGQKITFQIVGPALSDFWIALADASAEHEWLVGGFEGAYPRSATFIVPTGGTYYFDIFAMEGAGSYTVTYNVGPADPDDLYPGVEAPASPITGSLSSTDDQDYYSVSLAAGDKISFQVTGDPGTDFLVSLLGPNGRDDYRAWPFSETYPMNATYAVAAGRGGTYSFEVFRASLGGNYTLTYQIEPADPDDQYPGVAIPASPVNGSLDYLHDTDDLFAINLTQGQRLTASVTSAAGTPGFALVLFDASLSDVNLSDEVDYSGVGEYPRTITYTAPVTGKYYIDVSAYQGIDDYTLEYSVGATPPKMYVKVEGANRYATAVAASKQAFPKGAPCVVIATGENWPDALGGAALAAAKGGPILLTNSASLTPAVKAEIVRLGANEAIVLGGTKAVSVDAFRQIDALVGPTRRIAGDNRYLTADAIARAVVAAPGSKYAGACFVTTGLNFPDALGASPVSAAAHTPILLTPPSGLTAGTIRTIEAIEADTAVVLGGKAAVPEAVSEALEGAELVVTRLYGENRYATAAAVAAFGEEAVGLTYDKVAIATGTNFPDALAAGAMQAVDGSLMLLTPPTTLAAAPKAVLAANKWNIDTVRFMGGTAALPEAVRNQVKSALYIPAP